MISIARNCVIILRLCLSCSLNISFTGTAYSIGNGVPSEVNNEIVSHEIVPLKIREKRQVSVSIPPSSSPPQVSAPSKTSPIGKQNSIWANKTRNPVTTGQSQSPSSGSDGTNLLRNPGNIFTSNNATEHQTTILPAVEEDDAFINGTLAEIPFSPTDFNKENYTEKVRRLTIATTIQRKKECHI